MSENQDKVYERLKNSKFKQQKLPGWRPVPTIASTTIIFICFGVIFILLGTLILIFSNQIIEIQKQYDNIPQCKDSKICNISIEIEQDMDNPWRLKILKDWYYRISYWWTIEVLNATELIVSIVRNTEWVNKEITGDHYKWITSTILSGWRTIWCSLLRWDYISMWVSADDSIKMLKDYSYLEIQYVRAAI